MLNKFKKPQDSVIKDLQKIIKRNIYDDAVQYAIMDKTRYQLLEDLLMIDLSLYMASRDHKILDHGIELGKKRA